MADRVGVSPATVQRVWSELGLKPHRVDTFKISNDPRFTEKLIDVVGLYLDPPEKAIVLCMDEKSSIQALDRTQASLPLVPGRAATMTHDYKRNGTTTLFAALDVLTGTVIGQCLPRHRHEEFLTFLKTIDAEVPRHLQVHLILDNYATHKHPNVQAWLKRHKRFHLHFTPTSSSWLNQVERWFRDLTDKNLRRGIFASVPDLIASIQTYIDTHNADPEALRLDRHRRVHPRQGRTRPNRAQPNSNPKLRRTTRSRPAFDDLRRHAKDVNMAGRRTESGDWFAEAMELVLT